MIYFTCKRTTNVKRFSMMGYSESSCPLDQNWLNIFLNFTYHYQDNTAVQNLPKTDDNDRTHKTEANTLS